MEREEGSSSREMWESWVKDRGGMGKRNRIIILFYRTAEERRDRVDYAWTGSVWDGMSIGAVDEVAGPGAVCHDRYASMNLKT